MVSFADRITIKHIYACLNSSYIITDLGYVYAWGNNNDGQLGLSSFINIEVPKKIQHIPEISELIIRGKQVIALQYHLYDEEDSCENEDNRLSADRNTLRFSVKTIHQGTESVHKKESLVTNHEYLAVPRMEALTLSRNTSRSKSNRSCSKRSARSNSSLKTNGEIQPLTILLMQIKEAIPVILEFYKQLDSIDRDIEKQFQERDTVRSNPVAELIKKLNILKEQCHNDFEKELSLKTINDDKINEDAKNLIKIIRKSILDSLALRSLQILTI